MATTDTHLCMNCGKPAAGQLVCEGCGVVRPLQAEPDFFSLFGLAQSLAVDAADLERRYYALSRELHPDLFHDRSPAEQAASLQTTALVTRAYRTLKDPVQRGLYWLSLHGESLGRDNERVPAELASLVFEVQEKLEELRRARGGGGGAAAEADELREIRAELRVRLDGFEQRLLETYARDRKDGARADERRGAGAGGGAERGARDGGAALADIKRILSELHYVRTLARDVDKELEPQWNAS